MTKALLMLTGGRGIPDMLMVKYLRPDITLTVTTKQGLGTARHLQELVKAQFGCKLEIQPVVHPYKEQDIKDACNRALDQYPNAEWIMNITSAPKIVSIFAMDVARERDIPCWFLNTDEGEVISLAKDASVDHLIDHQKIFNATVQEYMSVYQRQYTIPKSAEYRKKAQSWYNIAQVLVQKPKLTHLFLSRLRQAQTGRSQYEPVTFTIDVQAKPLIQQLAVASLNVVTINGESADTLECTIVDGEKREFLNGDWLEVYVWKEVEEAGFAQDYQWGYKIIHKQDEYELDLVLTARGLLFIAECKTDYDPFTRRSHYLDTIEANASLLGGAFVTKFFITNHPDPESIQSYTSFHQQAEQKKIRILTAQQLPNIGSILRDEVTNPTFSRV
jgi:hypothetical protein